MSNHPSLLHVASPSMCNMQQKGIFRDFHATDYATITQQVSLKALATHAFLRNSSRNCHATSPLSAVQQELYKTYVFVAQKTHPSIGQMEAELLALDAVFRRPQLMNNAEVFSSTGGDDHMSSHVTPHLDAWVNALNKLLARTKPKAIKLEKWSMVLDHTCLMLHSQSGMLAKLVQHGWSFHDILGCHPTHPEQRYDYMGLLLLVGNRMIEDIRSEVVTLRTPLGSIQQYKRELFLPSDRILLTDLGTSHSIGNLL